MEKKTGASDTTVMYQRSSDPEFIALLDEARSLELSSMMSYSMKMLVASDLPDRAMERRFFDYSRQDKHNAERLEARILRLGGRTELSSLESIAERCQSFTELGPKELASQSLTSETEAVKRYLELHARAPATDIETCQLLGSLREAKELRAGELLSALAIL